MTTEQAEEIMDDMSTGPGYKTQENNLEGCSFSVFLDLELLATAMNKLEEVSLPKLPGHLIKAITTTLASGGFQLFSLSTLRGETYP